MELYELIMLILAAMTLCRTNGVDLDCSDSMTLATCSYRMEDVEVHHVDI